MVTMEQVKADLREIRYYYAREKDFTGASRSVGRSSVTELAERYNAAVCKASARLYDVYVSLYVNNNTQLAVALDWECSPDYVKRLNRQLCEFLQKEFNQKN